MQTVPVSWCLLIIACAAPTLAAQTQPLRLDPTAAQKFCDLGLVRSTIEVNVEKLLKLGFKVEPKMLVAIQGEALVQIALLTQYCRLVAVGIMSPRDFQDKTGSVSQFSVDLQALTQKATIDTKSAQPAAPQVDAGAVAKDLGLNTNPSINVNGDLQLVIRGFLETYICACSPQKR